MNTENKLDGQLLIAMPGMADPRFRKAVIYICSHSPDGTMGLVINHPHEALGFPELLKQLNVAPAGENLTDVDVMIGGPVEPGQGFVLHSSDYNSPGATVEIKTGISLTATMDIIKAMAEGHGPRQALFTLGYAGWGAGQLESELLANTWLTAPADADLLFTAAHEAKYSAALARLGINPAMLSRDAGHA